MATPVWQPGTLYPPGSLVRPTGPLAPPAPSISNTTFDANATGWTLSGSMAWSASGGFASAGCVVATTTAGGAEVTAYSSVIPGQVITATAMIATPTGSAGSSGDVNIVWYDSGNVFIDDDQGNIVSRAGGTGYRMSTASFPAPANAAFFRVRLDAAPAGGGAVRFDNITVASSGGAVPEGLVYKAVQAGIGTSAASEPVWPPSVGLTVVDGTVTWEAVIATRITYKAFPILKSGATEPTWPQGVGTSVPDGTISWLTDSRQVVQAPNSNVVAITASKVFAADEDIIRYSATINPLDWTSTDDAGYLPSGLNQNGSNDTDVLNIYRASLVSFSSTTFQNWQVDPDPANMSLLDVMEGIGSTWQHAAQPVGKDLFYLAKLGVRTVGISAGSTNLVNGDVGMPIDPLVRESVKSAEYNGSDVNGLYYPSLGQYWLAFSDFPPPGLFISGLFASWSTTTDYEGRISFGNEVGLVSVAWTGGDPLPVGAALTIDNVTKEIVLILPATAGPGLMPSFDFSFQITDSLGRQEPATRSVSIAIPDLSLTGSLPGWNNSTVYSNTLSINNQIGACSIVSVVGALPLDWSVTVDNPNADVVFSGPADPTYPAGTANFTVNIIDGAGRPAQWIGSIEVTSVPVYQWIAFNSGDQSTGGYVLSTNGQSWPNTMVQWQSTNLGTGNALYNTMASGRLSGVVCVALSRDATFSSVPNSAYMHSVNLTTWTAVPAPVVAGVAQANPALIIGNGFMFRGAPGGAISGGVGRASNPSGIWAYTASPGVDSFNLMAYLPGSPNRLLLGWTARDYASISTNDGTSITINATPVFSTNDNIADLFASDTRFFALHPTLGVRWSTTGLPGSWNASTLTLGGKVLTRGHANIAGIVVLGCDDGSFFASSDNGTSFALVVGSTLGTAVADIKFAGNVWAACGNNKIAYTTAPATAWTTVTHPIATGLTSLCPMT